MSRPPGLLEIWEQSGAWRWLYRNPEEGTVLIGNRSYPTRPAALAAARRAYPGVPLGQMGATREHLGGRTLLAAALGAVGAGATLALRRLWDRR